MHSLPTVVKQTSGTAGRPKVTKPMSRPQHELTRVTLTTAPTDDAGDATSAQHGCGESALTLPGRTGECCDAALSVHDDGAAQQSATAAPATESRPLLQVPSCMYSAACAFTSTSSPVLVPDVVRPSCVYSPPAVSPSPSALPENLELDVRSWGVIKNWLVENLSNPHPSVRDTRKLMLQCSLPQKTIESALLTLRLRVCRGFAKSKTTFSHISSLMLNAWMDDGGLDVSDSVDALGEQKVDPPLVTTRSALCCSGGAMLDTSRGPPPPPPPPRPPSVRDDASPLDLSVKVSDGKRLASSRGVRGRSARVRRIRPRGERSVAPYFTQRSPNVTVAKPVDLRQVYPPQDHSAQQQPCHYGYASSYPTAYSTGNPSYYGVYCSYGSVDSVPPSQSWAGQSSLGSYPAAAAWLETYSGGHGLHSASLSVPAPASGCLPTMQIPVVSQNEAVLSATMAGYHGPPNVASAVQLANFSYAEPSYIHGGSTGRHSFPARCNQAFYSSSPSAEGFAVGST